MLFGYMTLATALIISLSAAVYSILGLTAIFAAAFWPIVVLGGSLEIGKIVTTLWLHKYWNRAEIQYKVYLCAAVGILMVLTSMGVFGFLSKAHLDQAVPSGDVAAKVQIFDDKIKTQRDNIEAARRALTQMDSAVDQTMSRSTSEQGADKSAALRRSQGKERTALQNDISKAQKEITTLQEQRAPIAAEMRKVEAEVGPIKYIAALIYGDNPEANVLEKAVRWVIILIVIVFDPLALTLLLAATKTFEWEHEIDLFNLGKKKEDDETPFDDWTEEDFDALTKDIEEKEKADIILKQGVDHADGDVPVFDREEIPLEEDSLTESKLSQDPTTPGWMFTEQPTTIKQKLFTEEVPDYLDRIKLEPDNVNGIQSEHRGFGSQFPTDANRGDMFLRVDQTPTELYKFNGNDWIAVPKNHSDQYAYHDAYVDHLIDKLVSGEYDLELLSDAEREAIEQRLNTNSTLG